MRIAFTLICLGFMTLIQAQDLSLNQVEWALNTGDVIDYGEITLTNNSSETVSIAITLEKICQQTDDAAAMQICVGDLCFKPVNATTTWGENLDPSDALVIICLLYTSPSPRDATLSRMPSSA